MAQLHVNFPTDNILYDKVRAQADKEHRSASNWVVALVAEHFGMADE